MVEEENSVSLLSTQSTDIRNIETAHHFFPDKCVLMGSCVDLSDEERSELDFLINRESLSDFIKSQKIEDGVHVGKTIFRFSTSSPLGAEVIYGSPEIRATSQSLVRSRTVHHKDLLAGRRDIASIFEELKSIMVSSLECYSHVGYFGKNRFDDILLEDEIRKSRDFHSTVDHYYHSKPSEEPNNSPNRLIFGENHENNLATGSMKNMMGYFAQNKMPIFLEFLEWETYEPILKKYYESEPGSEEFGKAQKLLDLLIPSIERDKRRENVDLLELIKTARMADVRVYPAETIISFRQSHDAKAGYIEGRRCCMANYATTKIVEEVSPDKFAILYGNRHLLNEGEYPSLPEMLGAVSISFYQETITKEDATALEESVNISCNQVMSAVDLVSKIYETLPEPIRSISPARDREEKEDGREEMITPLSQADTQRF